MTYGCGGYGVRLKIITVSLRVSELSSYCTLATRLRRRCGSMTRFTPWASMWRGDTAHLRRDADRPDLSMRRGQATQVHDLNTGSAVAKRRGAT
jgi:hypothetical protein